MLRSITIEVELMGLGHGSDLEHTELHALLSTCRSGNRKLKIRVRVSILLSFKCSLIRFSQTAIKISSLRYLLDFNVILFNRLANII